MLRDCYASLALLGQFSDDRSVIDSVAAEFGWQTVEAADSRQLEQLHERGPVVGTLVDMSTCANPDSVSSAPRAVLCTGAAARVPEEELEKLGAFDALLLPLQRDELRQSLGFLAAALRR
ncbi:MAG: hypothetical protein IT162_14195 [Bryobacterales bacterium]|nr:hypothetical protein [Bryobacterales bacterium]